LFILFLTYFEKIIIVSQNCQGAKLAIKIGFINVIVNNFTTGGFYIQNPPVIEIN
jgi:hypothetical protein